MFPPEPDADKLWQHTEEQIKDLLERCEMAGKIRTYYYMRNSWIENDEDGFSGWRWIKYNKPLRLVSAANRYKDIIVCGVRHSCPLMVTAMAMYGGTMVLRKYSGDDHEQGFVDQFGTFYNRKEAMELAVSNGQLLYPDNCPGKDLFSEGLY